MKKYLVIIPQCDYEIIGGGNDGIAPALKDRIIEAENADDAIYNRVFEDGYTTLSEHAVELIESALAIEIADDKIYKFTKDMNKALEAKKAQEQEKLELEQLRKLKAKYEK
jgi:hypothetical protein